MEFEFSLKTKTIVGQGSISKIIPFIEENHYNRVGLIIDQAMKENAFVNSFLGELEKANVIAVKWYYDLPFEPDYKSLDKIKLLFKDNEISKVNVIVAIGGGSVMDFGKGIATLATNHEPALMYRGFPKGLNMSIPLIAVPTTAGTASEVTFNAVFTDTDSGRKLGINTQNNFPVMAVIDSNMTKNSPYSVALSSGLDALVHTFESFACNKNNSYTRMFAKEAFKFLFNNIEKALTDESADQSRENMLFGAYLAGVSLFNAGSGPAGAMSYPLGVIYKVPHGIAGGIILPYLIKFNVDSGYTEYAELYDILPIESSTHLSSIEKSQNLVKLIFDLYERLKVWDIKSNYQVDMNNPTLIEYINLLQGAFDQNPVKMLTQDGIDILKKVFNEKTT